MGAAIAQLVALDYPERTRSLTSISGETGNLEMPGPTEDVLALPPSPPAGSDIETIVAHQVLVWEVLGSPAYPTDQDLLRERIRREVERSHDPIDLERQEAAIFAAGDRRERLRRLDVPTVVLHGDADKIVPVENGRDTAANIPGAELIIVPGMGHDVPLQLVPTFADAITQAAVRSGEERVEGGELGR